METVKGQEKSVIRESEFPSFIPPLMVKELRRGLRTNGFVLFMILFPLLMAVPFLFQAVWGEQVVARAVIDVVFWLGVVCIFLIYNPLRALVGVRQEKVTRTDELIVLTRLTSYDIVSQKWWSLILQTLLLSVVILPFYLVRYLLGGVEIAQEAGILAALFVVSCSASAVALWVSGLPGIYKVFYCFTLVAVGVFVVVLTASSEVFSVMKASASIYLAGGARIYSLYGGLTLLLSVAFYGLSCRAFLFMASRWFAPPSENTDLGFRKTVLWMIAVFGVFFALSWMTGSSGVVAQSNLTLSRSILMQGVGGLCLLDMICSRRVKVIHWKKLKEQGGWMRRLGLLFLPGWQGAGLMILLTGMTGCLLAAVCAVAAGHPEYLEAGFRASLLVCANYLFMGVVFQPLYKRTGDYSLLIYFALSFGLSTIASVGLAVRAFMPGMDFYLSLLSFVPMCSGMVQEWSATPEVMSKLDIKWDEHLIVWGNWTLITVTFLIFLISAFSFWRKIFRLEKVCGSS